MKAQLWVAMLLGWQLKLLCTFDLNFVRINRQKSFERLYYAQTYFGISDYLVLDRHTGGGSVGDCRIKPTQMAFGRTVI